MDRKGTMNEVEINHIDCRFEQLRLKNSHTEKLLLSSIAECGIRDPLSCIITPNTSPILLDGFKRIRCCRKLNKHIVPVISLGDNEANALIQFIRLTNAQSLNIFEQAALVDQLRDKHGMRIYEIANSLERSPAWVSIRLGIISEISETVRAAIFSGRFPARSYLYTLRNITRVNKVTKEEVDQFVVSTAGKGLSTRNIETLAYGFFRGGTSLKEQILQGKLDWTLKQMKHSGKGSEDPLLNEKERQVIKSLELVQKYMAQVVCGLQNSQCKSTSFILCAQILIEGIIEKNIPFKTTVQEWHDTRK